MRRRGLSMQELIVTVGLTAGLISVLGVSLGSATELRDEVLAISSVRERGLHVRAAVGRAVRGGSPIKGLTLAPTAEPGVLRLFERWPGGNWTRAWSFGRSLVCRVPEGYRTVGLEGDRLIETTLVAGGTIRRRLIATRVKSARFRIVSGGARSMRGVSYRVRLSWPKQPGGEEVVLDGFVAQRINETVPATSARTTRGALR